MAAGAVSLSAVMAGEADAGCVAAGAAEAGEGAVVVVLVAAVGAEAAEDGEPGLYVSFVLEPGVDGPDGAGTPPDEEVGVGVGVAAGVGVLAAGGRFHRLASDTLEAESDVMPKPICRLLQGKE